MAMDKDKKAQLLMILAKRKPQDQPDDGESEDTEDTDYHSEGLKSAAKDLLQGIKTSDTDAMSEALCNFMDLYDKDDSSESDKEDESEGE